MRYIVWFAGLVLAIVASMYFVSFAGSLISQPNDVAFALGSIILLALVCGWVVFVAWAIRRYPKQSHKEGNSMKGLLVLLLCVSMCIGIGSGCSRVEPGYVGIKVNQYGGNRGVDEIPIVTGRVFFNPFTEDIYRFPVFIQTRIWTQTATEGSQNDDSITFNSVEGTTINTDVGVSVTFVAEKIPALFVAFRKDANYIMDTYVRNQVRDSFNRIASSMPLMDIYGAKKQELLKNVIDDLNTRLGTKGIVFDNISMIGEPRLPATVKTSINAVIDATNKANEARATMAERMYRATGDSLFAVNVAKGQAEANKVLSASISETLVRYKQMDAELEKAKNWKPQVIGNATPLVTVK